MPISDKEITEILQRDGFCPGKLVIRMISTKDLKIRHPGEAS